MSGRRHAAATATLGLLLVSCAAPPAAVSRSPAVRPSPPAETAVPAFSQGCGRAAAVAAGDHQYTIRMDPALAGGASQRTAVVHIPSRYTSTRAAALVMEFHGAGVSASAAGYEAASPLHTLSDAEGFIDVFPQGLRYLNGNLGWNAYGPVYVKIAEIPFVNKLLDAIEADYCVDRSRVYASGASNGGNMVNYVACRDAERFAAVAPVVGPMFGQDDGPCRPSRPMPMIDVHSINDPVVPYGGHPGLPAYDFPLASVPVWLAGWAGLDGCPGSPSMLVTSDREQERTWMHCVDGARIEAYATTAGHAWPATLGGRSAAGVVWKFLASFHL